jgi:hypothetical protein
MLVWNLKGKIVDIEMAFLTWQAQRENLHEFA